MLQNAAQAPRSYALGASRTDTVFYEAIDPNGATYNASGILIRSVESDWVLLARHVVQTSTWTVDPADILIGNGPSYMTDRGTTVGITEFIIYTEGDPGNTRTGADMAFGRLAQRLSGPSQFFTFAEPLQLGQGLVPTSYGIPAAMNGDIIPNEGRIMGITGEFSLSQPAGWDRSRYNSAQFFSPDPNSGVESPRGSGGAVEVWNPTANRYDKVGMTIAGNSSATFFLDFSDPEVFSAINRITMPLAVPEPGTLLFGLYGFIILALRRCRARLNRSPLVLPLVTGETLFRGEGKSAGGARPVH